MSAIHPHWWKYGRTLVLDISRSGQAGKMETSLEQYVSKAVPTVE